jgi:hypothetical protein
MPVKRTADSGAAETSKRRTRNTASGHSRQKTTAVGRVSSTHVHVDNDEIARLAYSLWESRGCQDGDPMEDWLRAEQEIQERTPSAK